MANPQLKLELYFAYGSNLDERQMLDRCPGARPAFRARLVGYRLDFTHFSASRWKGGTADLLPDEAETVWGLVYAMGDGDFARLDLFEGGYERVVLCVEDDSGSRHQVTSYAVREKSSFPPHQHYLDKIVAGAERLAFPSEYVARLRARYRS